MIRSLLPLRAWLLMAMISLIAVNGAFAQSLSEAKAQGLIGERADGYIGAVGNAGPVQALIDDINAKRQAKYADIAAQRGASTEDVAKIAGMKLIERTPAGQFVRGDNGKWVKK